MRRNDLHTEHSCVWISQPLLLRRMRFSLSGDMENNLRELQQQQMSKEFNCKCFIMIYLLLSHFIQLFKCKRELNVWNYKMKKAGFVTL